MELGKKSQVCRTTDETAAAHTIWFAIIFSKHTCASVLGKGLLFTCYIMTYIVPARVDVADSEVSAFENKKSKIKIHRQESDTKLSRPRGPRTLFTHLATSYY